MNMMFSCLFGVGYVVLRYRKSGFLKRLHATPLTAFEFLSAQVLSRLGLILLVTAILYAGIGAVIGFHNAGNLLLLALVGVVGALSMIALGLTIAARFSSEELVGGLLNVLTWPMMLLSGIWFSLEGSPPWVQWVAHVFPLTHVLDAARAVMLDGAGLPQIEPNLLYLGATALAQLALDALPASVHTVRRAAVSLTQATELGTVYRPAEIAALSNLAHQRGLRVHMDGARFANAVAFLDCHPADLTWRAGVDVLSLGATKNGALAAEAVVFFDRELVRDFELRRKRAGHLLSKSRYVAAQLLAYVESGVWRRNAERTNRLAQDIGRAAAASLMHPVQANEVFVALGVQRRQALRAAGFEFYDWGAEGAGAARFVVSWDQPDADVPALCAALGRL